MSQFNRNLRRYHLPQHACDGCVMPEGVIEDGLHLLARIHPGKGSRRIIEEYNCLRNMTHDICPHNLRKFLKECTGWLKLGGRFIDPNWRLLTYWETNTGYVPPVELGTLKHDVDDWLTCTKHNGSRIDEERYVADIYAETCQFLTEEWDLPRDLPTAQEWVKSGVWMRGRAGTGDATSINIEGKSRRTRRYKGVDAALKRDVDIELELFDTTQETMRIMQKSEGGKVRPVVVGGNKLYRKMDFLSELIDNGLRGSRSSTLFAGASGNEQIDNTWVEHVRNPLLLKVPLDQSSFDNNQSKSTILAVLSAMGDTCLVSESIPKDYARVWRAMWSSMTTTVPLVEMNGEHRRWENGVPSGWRWTALLDTILNIVSFRIARRYCREYYDIGVPVGDATMQGDDVIFTTNSVGSVEALVAMYQTLGYKVHPHKTYISRERGEFLRRSYETDGITGYTPRTLLALRFRNPIVPMPISPAERLYSRLALWSLARQRGGEAGVCADLYIEDAVQAGIEASMASAFALTPATYGGAGLETEQGRMGARLTLRFGRDQAWVRPRIKKPSLKITPKLGCWKERLQQADLAFTGTYRDQFHSLLAITWGMREADITGKSETVWERIPKREALTPGGAVPLPDADGLWEMSGIPHLIRSIVKAESLDDGTYLRWIKDNMRDWVQYQRKRMSRTVFRIYMLGQWTVPTPICDDIAMKYGAIIKKKAKQVALGVFAVRNITLLKLEQKFLSIEAFVRRGIRSLYSHVKHAM